MRRKAKMNKEQIIDNRIMQKAETLVEALPYIQKFQGAVVVVKYGGAAMLDEELKKHVMQDIAILKLVGLHPIVVHGGGKEISKWIEKVGMEPSGEAFDSLVELDVNDGKPIDNYLIYGSVYGKKLTYAFENSDVAGWKGSL